MKKELKRIEECFDKAVTQFEEVYFAKDSDGKCAISELDMEQGSLTMKLMGKLKTIMKHVTTIKEQLEELEKLNKRSEELIK
jgi:hypothetical protein